MNKFYNLVHVFYDLISKTIHHVPFASMERLNMHFNGSEMFVFNHKYVDNIVTGPGRALLFQLSVISYSWSSSVFYNNIWTQYWSLYSCHHHIDSISYLLRELSKMRWQSTWRSWYFHPKIISHMPNDTKSLFSPINDEMFRESNLWRFLDKTIGLHNTKWTTWQFMSCLKRTHVLLITRYDFKYFCILRSVVECGYTFGINLFWQVRKNR